MNKQKEIILYKKDNIKFAKKLRREATYSEKIFWNAVRNSQIGYTFIRQKSIGYYIFDFYCKDLKLEIELDGIIHEIEEVKQNYLNKEEYLKGLGLNLLRFQDEDVVNNLSGVLETILLFAKSCDPTPTPPVGQGARNKTVKAISLFRFKCKNSTPTLPFSPIFS